MFELVKTSYRFHGFEANTIGARIADICGL
jgi:hypothetical protein